MVDVGFVVGAFVPLVLYWMSVPLPHSTSCNPCLTRFGNSHLRAVWRQSLVLGVVPTIAVFFWRPRMEEPTLYKRDSMKNISIPYKLVIKRYWRGLLGISLAWFIYDFITYVNDRAHSSQLVAHIPPDTQYDLRHSRDASSLMVSVVRNLFIHNH